MEKIFMLAFDHRSTFKKIFANVRAAKQKQKIMEAKKLVFKAVVDAISSGAVMKRDAAVLCDEEYGSGVLLEAKKKGIRFALPVEKSGRQEFEFEHKNFGQHIKKFSPTFVKVLVRYNPVNKELNKRQLARLLVLQAWLKKNGFPLLFELLVPPTPRQLAECGSVAAFDEELRPSLTAQSIIEITSTGVAPDVWKLEGVSSQESAQIVFGTARKCAPNAKIIVLGRGESLRQVEKWVAVAAREKSVVGFAVGRTIFFDALKEMLAGKISEKKAVAEISSRYVKLSKLFCLNN